MLMPIDDKSNKPIYIQIYEFFKTEILKGNFKAGDKLPSSRGLAFEHHISRNTVENAYDQLVSEGYIEAKEKSGYYVCNIKNLFDLGMQERKVEKHTEKKEKLKYDFSPFSVDTEKFPVSVWKKISNKYINELADRKDLKAGEQGEYAFRAAICAYLKSSRGVKCVPEQIIIGAGIDYLMQLLCQLFRKKDFKFAFENPAYIRAFKIVKGFGYEIVPVDVKKDGLDVSALKQSNAQVVYCTPAHQYPAGVVMSAGVRSELLEWANTETEERYIIEDDHDSEFRYKGIPIPALQGYDEKGRVIYMGTFSRVIAPFIRVGYMVLPPELLELYKSEFGYYSSTVSQIDQEIITEFITGGYFERHLNKMRKTYKTRHDYMLTVFKEIKEELTEKEIMLELESENAGFYITVSINIKTHIPDEEQFIKEARNYNLSLYGMKSYFISTEKYEGCRLMLGFAGMDEQTIYSGLNELKKFLISFSEP